MQKIIRIKPALIAVLVTLAVVLTGQFRAVNAADGATLQLQSAVEAKRLLDQMSRARIEKIRDVRLRAELLRGYDALKAVAENTTRTSEKILLARVHNVALKLKAKAEEIKPAGFSLNECNDRLEDCKELGTPPHLCQLNDDACIMMAWIATLFPPGAPT